MTLRVAEAWRGIDHLNPPAMELQNREASRAWLKLLAVSLLHLLTPVGATFFPLRIEDLERVDLFPDEGLSLSYWIREEWIEWERVQSVLLEYAPLPWADKRYVITFQCAGHTAFDVATDSETADRLFELLRQHCGDDACGMEFSCRDVTVA